MLYVIGNKNFSVAVESRGAQLNSIKKNGEEKLWQNYDGSWDDHAPLLFPVCGNVNIIVNGKQYPFCQHGFAQNCEFEKIFQSERKISLSLKSSEETLKFYPFDFELIITYSVENSTLFLNYEIRNNGKTDMFYGIGGHESFNVKGELSDYYAELEYEESPDRYYHDDNGWLTECEKTEKFKKISFKDIPLNNDETLILSGLKSTWCALKSEITGETVAKSHFKGLTNLLFWRPDGAPVVCIEPWSNLPDRFGEKAELSDKKGIFRLPSGKTSVLERKIEY